MTEITYTRNGDYFIPDIVLKKKEYKPLGKYGRMRKDYLKNHRPALWNRFLLKDKLDDHLHEIDSEAQIRFDTLLPLYCERFDVTEELKATDQMEWVRRMNNIISAIEEIILLCIKHILKSTRKCYLAHCLCKANFISTVPK